MTNTFHGNWQIDIAQSRIWDYDSARYMPEVVGQEQISIRLDGGVQDYEVLLGERPIVRMGYASRYDDAQWVPYTVREITGTPEETSEAGLQAFASRIKSRVTHFSVGAIYGLVRTVYVDERTHYRFSKNATTGLAEYTMLRRLSEDGQSYVASVFRVDGVVSNIRRFIRVPWPVWRSVNS